MKWLSNLNLASRIYRLSGTVVLLFLLIIGWLFLQFRATLHETRKDEIRTLVETAWQVLDFHAREATSGRMTVEEAQRRALAQLRYQRFDGNNYFWVSDLASSVVMHPLRPDLEGRSRSEFDVCPLPLFQSMADLVRKNGEGFLQYAWPVPGGTEPLDKISYVKGFPPWGWIIGAGLHVEDLDGYLLRLALGTGLGLLLVITGAVLLVRLVARSISVPAGQAVEMIEALQRGDLNHRLRLNQKDEVGRLAAAMDAFADNLQDEILTAFDRLSNGDFSFQAKGFIGKPLARTNARLNTLVAELHGSVAREREERSKTEAMINAIGDAVAIFDREKRCIYQNPLHAALAGSHVGEPCSQVFRPEDHACDQCPTARAMADGSVHQMVRRISSAGGEIFLEATASPVRDADGEIVSVIEIARDITERKQAEEALLESEARYFSLFHDNQAVMLLIDPETAAIVDANPAACAFYACRSDELVGAKITENNLLSPEEIFRAIEGVRTRRQHHFHLRHLLPTGEIRDVEVYSGPIQIQGRELLFGIVHDVSERIKAEERVKYLAFHDPLTGLGNRVFLEERLEQALAHAHRHQEPGALFFLDLDRFKIVNDSLGHHAGDLLLRAVGETIKGILRAEDTVCRQGGDEFILLLPHLKNGRDAARLAERILQLFAAPFSLEGREVFLSPSIGISFFPQDGTDMATLIKNADAAMYLAKERGRNNYQFFRPELTLAIQERLGLESELRQALTREELQLHYQPLVDATTGEIIGVEALLRWNHPSLGSVPPARFIPIAEESGLIEQIGTWVLRTACSQARFWQENGWPPFRVAVNVSGRQFRQPDFVDLIDEILAATGLDSRLLELEVTENIIMENVEETIMTLTDLKVRGISLAIDDFGTGYSSLSYLRQFPIDRLKIDRSFVADIPINADAAAIAEAIISLAGALNLEVTAEGVETAEQAEFLRERRCNALQGYLFGRPAPADAWFPPLTARGRRTANA